MPSLADRYLARLGVARPEVADLASLQVLLEAHLRTIPFENVSSFLGSSVSLDPEECFKKLLDDGRGGYCMEHALLSRTALAELGYTTAARFARVLLNATAVGAQTHGITIVTIDGEDYVFDPGFGGYGPSTPLRLSSREEQGVWNAYRYREPPADVKPELVGADVGLIFETKMGDNWVPLYGIVLRPVVLVDIEAFNWYVCTRPSSVFVTSLMASAWDGDKRVTGFNRFWKKRNGDEVEQGEIKSSQDVDRWLRREMRLGISDEQVEAVWNKLKTIEPVPAS